MNEKHVFIITMTRISEDLQIFPIVTFFAIKKNVQTSFAHFHIISSNSCTILTDTKRNFVNFIQKILISATIKAFAHLPIHRTKSSKTLSLFIYSKRTQTFTSTSSRQYGVLLHKSIFICNPKS